jgi:catechol 2,3-dioxygenase-like lactoylglutathione lyase family enzyme
MITGAHVIVYSADAEADRAFLRDVLGLRGVDAGGGWLIFALPSAELAVHPAEHDPIHELYLLTEDVAALVAELRLRGASCTDPEGHDWGVLTQVTLPGGGLIGVYEPRHERP